MLTREVELALALGEIDSACQLLSEARQLPGGSLKGDLAAEAYALQAFARWDKPTRAIASLERAVEAAPARADLRRLHGNLLRRLGMLKPAASELTEAHCLAPEDPRIAFEALVARLAAGQPGDGIERLAALLPGPEANRARAILAVQEETSSPHSKR